MKDKTTAIILAFFLGWIGVHKFYLDRAGAGVVYLIFFWTMIPAFVAIIDFIVLLTMSQPAFDRRYNAQPALAGPQVVVNVGDHPSRNPHALSQLKELNELRLAGALTDAEFNAQKRRLLGP